MSLTPFQLATKICQSNRQRYYLLDKIASCAESQRRKEPSDDIRSHDDDGPNRTQSINHPKEFVNGRQGGHSISEALHIGCESPVLGYRRLLCFSLWFRL